MKQYDIENIRTIAVMGHLGSGKTSFMESVLYVTNSKETKGSVEDKNTTSDYLDEEKSHQISLSMSHIPVEYGDYKYNFLDTPGNREFVTEVYQALSVVKGAVLLVDGAKGIDVGTELVLSELNERNIPTIIFINKMDKENIKFEGLITDLKKVMGNKAVPFLWPIEVDNDFKGYVNLIDMKTRVLEDGKVVDGPLPDFMADTVHELRDSIVESVAMTSEELLDKHFAGEELTLDEITTGLRTGVLNGDLKPIVIGSSKKNIGVRDILDMIAAFMPAPNDLKPKAGIDPETKEAVSRKTTKEDPFSAYVFKTTIDPFIGSINFIKIFSGTLSVGQKVLIANNNESIKISSISILRGKEQFDVDMLTAGDIGVINKIDSIYTGCTLTDPKAPIIYQGPGFPTPTIYVAIHPKNKRDEDKISIALHKLTIEDPSFEFKRNPETSQLLVGGQGMTHISYILEKMKNMFNVDVDVVDQKIVYRESIKKSVEVEGRHKKQSGGSGQFGVVKMRFEPINPNESNFEFYEEIHGGTVPKNYFPAIEKGLSEAFVHGPLTGFPIIGIKATLLDGAYHAVDSNELSFKLAAQLAFKNASEKAIPTILEPIMKLEIIIKDEYVGDIMGDATKRRGRVLGMEPLPGNKQSITAEVPEAEIIRYTIDLNAMTQGTGVFTREFIRYDEVPASLTQGIVDMYKVTE